MTCLNGSEPVFPVTLRNSSGLSFEINANGSIRRILFNEVMLNLFLGTEIEAGPCNIYLRRLEEERQVIPLLGPASRSVFSLDGGIFRISGKEWGIEYQLYLKLSVSVPAWFWHVKLMNTGNSSRVVDLIHIQDLGLADYNAIRINEFYTSHYIDHTALVHNIAGTVLFSRQNLPMVGKHPWTMIGSLNKGISYATDALQVHGLDTRRGFLPKFYKTGLPGHRLQHEHSMAAIQDSPIRLEAGEAMNCGFFGWYEPDHPGSTSISDLDYVDKVLRLPEDSYEVQKTEVSWIKPSETLFGVAPLLNALDLTESEISNLFPGKRIDEELSEGRLLSFFMDFERHVVLKTKELSILRPHANILRTGMLLVPDEKSLTTTTWMAGIFNSMVTQGHVSINRFLSTAHSYLSVYRSNGQRIFLELSDGWCLLDVPSAFEMTPNTCRWIYKHSLGILEVRCEALKERHEILISICILSGVPARFLISNHVALNGDDGIIRGPVHYTRDGDCLFVFPVHDSELGRRFPQGGFSIEPLQNTKIDRVGGDELLYPDGRSGNEPFLCIITSPALSAGFVLRGNLIKEDKDDIAALSSEALSLPMHCYPKIQPSEECRYLSLALRLGEIMPWFIHNALIHYLAPRGTEQYTGGGWGTRDICQGPVELLLALGRFEPVRDILVRVFKAQNPGGDWPQWFTFFERERNIRAADSHGDIVFWPLIAISNYIIASGDSGILREEVPFFHPDGEFKAEAADILTHMDRALSVISTRMIPGTSLAAYGHGDWNDSMQPVDPAMRERLCSSWTVTLHYQTLRALACALRVAKMADRSAGLASQTEKIREEFNRLLVVDGTIAGFAYFREDGCVDYLLHPRDKSTGISFRLLPMIHAVINDLLTEEDAERHLRLISDNLLGVDGARLFDRPMVYRGGVMRNFQRAESASFFGREIGLMYTHAHLRYAEALAHYGDSEGFFHALCQVNPAGIQHIVPTATRRQSNCYYSSSDAAFLDRYEAIENYSKVRSGEIPLDGGWRIYSSGPGIWTRIVVQCFLGVRREKSELLFDPVIPKFLDGMMAEIEVEGLRLGLTYRIEKKGSGTKMIKIEGREIPFERRSNPYRTGAAEIKFADLRSRGEKPTIKIEVFIE
ncbi:MAG: hypothetical protein C4582_04925 [Desulfobacteraceae bacterium]|nr:MAG: hypothetical protein C4582_04925 [Desulfobacteraceae bacterium]